MAVVLEHERSSTDALEAGAGRLRRHRQMWISAVVALAYLGAAIAIMQNLWADPSGLVFTSNANDPVFFQWMLQHGVSVVAEGDNPLRTGLLNAPAGVNLMANTNVLAFALPLAPLTAWLGPYIVYVLLFTIGLAGTAYAWYHVMFRHFIGDRVAAIVGGAICGFGPGIVTHTNGHPNLTAQFMVPLILWRALDLRRSVRPVRDGSILAALIVIQAFLNEEVLLDTALAGLIFTLVYAACRPRAFRDTGRLLRGAAVASILSGAALAYPLWQQFTAPGHVDGLPLNQSMFPYRVPLASFVTLPGQSLFGDPVHDLALSRATEQNSFFGWPVLIITVAIIIVLWRSTPAIRALTVVGVLFAYAALGNRVTVADPDRSYPYSLWSHIDTLPVFDSILPTRLALVVLPVVALVFAHGIARARRSLSGRAYPLYRATAVLSLVVIAASLVTIIPRQPPVTTSRPVPQFFLDGTWRRYVPSGYTVLSTDPLDRVSGMRWSVAAGLDFGISGGYFFGPDPTGRAQYGAPSRPTIDLLRSAEKGVAHDNPRPATVRNAVADLRYWHTAIVVLTPGQPGEMAMIATLDELFGPGQSVDGIRLWDVRPITDGPEATYAGVDGRAGQPLPPMIR